MKADAIVRDLEWLMTVDSDRRVIRDAAVAIRDGRFVGVGKSSEIVQEFEADAVVDGRNRVATPGFVDSHLHPSFQLARGLADEVGTRKFLFERMFPYEAALSEADVQLSSLLSVTSLLKCGVTCFIDAGNYYPTATARAAKAAGIRLVLGRSAFDLTKAVLGILPPSMIESTDEAYERTSDLLDFVASEKNSRLTASVAFRGLSNASDALITRFRELADARNCMIQTHACFNYTTRDDSVASFGMTEIERLESLGVLDERMVLAHAGWLTPAEFELIVRRRPSLVSSPSSSLHNGYGNFAHGRLPELLALGVNVGLGSDHACSGIVDIVQEMRMFVETYKEIHANPAILPPERAVEMATINGARCAGLADRIGSVEVGKEADLVLFDARRPDWQPLFNPVSNLVYSATGDSVSDVFIAGERVVRDGELSTIDESALLDEVQAWSRSFERRSDVPRADSLLWPTI